MNRKMSHFVPQSGISFHKYRLPKASMLKSRYRKSAEITEKERDEIYGKEPIVEKEQKNGNKKKKGLVIAGVIVVIAIAAVVIYKQVYNMLFGGAVAVSIEDVYSTINDCKIPIACIVIVIIAAIVVAVCVRKKEIALRKMIRWQSFLASVLVIVVSVSAICLNIEYSLINKVMTGSKGLSEEASKESKELVEEIADEGIVLLKNDNNALPISKDTKLNIFGWGSTQPIYGGTGSGSVSEDTAVSLIQGIENAGFKTNKKLTKFYTDYRSDRPEVGMGGVDWTCVQPTIEDYNEAGIFEQAKEYSDTAVVVLTRSGGEGPDLPEKMSTDNTYNKTQQGDDVVYTTQKEDGGSDVSYLELTSRERDMLDEVNKDFSNVIVVVNSANAMELGFLNEYENVHAALWVAGAGETGFNALGSILSGDVNPSGKLVDTYVYDLTETPTYNNFGNFQYTNSSDVTGSDESTAAFVNYVEGIYVGYKFYETAAEEGLINYDTTVQYPFGYGLSYTTFDKKITSFEADGNKVTMKVKVTNTGDVAGKDVVEVYYTPPYYNGGIEKASTNLVEYSKTGEIKPGESEEVTVSFNYEDMASYDENVNQAYVLEHGDYKVTLNSDSHTVIDSRSITVDKDVIYDEDHDGARSTDETAATNQFEDSEGDVEYLSRADGFANYEEATAAPTDFEMSEEEKENYSSKATYNAKEYDSEDAERPTTGAKNGLKIQDMTGLDYDDEKWDDLLDQLTVEEMEAMVENGGFQMVGSDSVNNPTSTACDGPAGISSNFNSSISGTAFPPATLIAATWNQELAYERGQQMGKECNELGVTGWYGPAMNIHRSAFGGRDFEYYSEDATISYYTGAGEVKGATEKGVICYIKHFALNDQETNRTAGICTYATEQAIREIYLKAFEGAVKEGGSLGVMSSFNSIGTKWAGANKALLTSVLRNEWGFHGAVITDAMDPLADFYMDLNRGIRTGLTQGLSMTGGDGLIKDTDDANTVIALRNAAHDNLYAAANSNAMNNDTGLATWAKIFIGADVVIALLLVMGEVLVIRNYKRRKTDM